LDNSLIIASYIPPGLQLANLFKKVFILNVFIISHTNWEW